MITIVDSNVILYLIRNNKETKNKLDILEKMASEYVTVRGLTDTRLSGRIQDGI